MLNTDVNKTLRDEFNEIIEPYINHPKFQKLKHEIHHGITRFEHSIRVAWYTFLWAKRKGLDYVAATVTGLCHDFFIEEDCEHLTTLEVNKVHGTIAAKNAQKHFSINELVYDGIANHMYPFTDKPSSPEGVIVQYVDKIVAAYEFFISYNPVSIAYKKAAQMFPEPDYTQTLDNEVGPTLSLKRR